MIKNIIFDFDGVILDSIPVKTEAFRLLFSGYNEDSVNIFIEFHLKNGGMSRYLKIRYFFEQLLFENISEEKVTQLAEEYSELTKKELSQEKYLIQDTFNFIKLNYQKYNMHIASGAADDDLKYICNELGLIQYFFSINGSPQPKDEIIRTILNGYQYKKEETILIGDSFNDLEAAVASGIEFYGYNNLNLATSKYIDKFLDFSF